MSGAVISLNESSFNQAINDTSKPILVDFWAKWCGPCKAIAPILEEIATEYGDKITIAKLDVDENPSIAPNFGIRGIPALLLFKAGEVIATQVGAVTKAQLKAFIDSHI